MRKEMRRMFLMSSVLLAAPFLFGEMGEASAQCVATQDCASLGYTEASCSNGGLKCPFGNSWKCQQPLKPEESEGSCNICNVGDILNSDLTCTSTKTSGKTPIGVIYTREIIGTSGMNCISYAIALNDLSDNKQRRWNDVKSLSNNYKTSGTTTGEWFIPTMQHMQAIYRYKNTIEKSILAVGGAKFKPDLYWTSSDNQHSASGSNFNMETGEKNASFVYEFYARPAYVLTKDVSVGDSKYCEVGDILYYANNKKLCAFTKPAGATAIGVVIDTDINIAIALKDVGIKDWYEAQSSCAAYSSSGTSAGDWLLPTSSDIMRIVSAPAESINVSIRNAGGTEMVTGASTDAPYWTRTDGSGGKTAIRISDGYGSNDNESTYHHVRCVTSFTY